MIKSELILKIAEQNPHLYEQDAADIVNVILDTVADTLAQGDRVELLGLACSRPSGAAHVPDEIRARVGRSRCPRECFRCSR